MRADISAAKRNPGKSFDFGFEYQPDNSLINNGLASFTGKAGFTGSYFYSGGDIYVRGVIKYNISYPCDRCGEKTVFHGGIDFDEIFYQRESGGENYFYSGSEIDFLQAVNESIILDIPSGIICKKDCKGLCPVCGKNLNTGGCGCDTTADNPFGILKKL